MARITCKGRSPASNIITNFSLQLASTQKMKAPSYTLTPSCAIHGGTGRRTTAWTFKDAMAFFHVHAPQSCVMMVFHISNEWQLYGALWHTGAFSGSNNL